MAECPTPRDRDGGRLAEWASRGYRENLTFRALFLCVALALAVAAPAAAQAPAGQRTITVVGNASVTAPNDTATVSLGVTTRHATATRALADTSAWLIRPDRWDQAGRGQNLDRGLARIQFAAALTEGLDARVLTDRAALGRAAELVAPLQKPDGSWPVEEVAALSS